MDATNCVGVYILKMRYFLLRAVIRLLVRMHYVIHPCYDAFDHRHVQKTVCSEDA